MDFAALQSKLEEVEGAADALRAARDASTAANTALTAAQAVAASALTQTDAAHASLDGRIFELKVLLDALAAG